MALPRTSLVTEAEFLSLPESLDKIELIDGEVILSPSPTAAHQLAVQTILVGLVEWARRQPGPVTVGQAPWDVRFGDGRILQPDLFVVLDRVSREQAGPLDRVPELCVEVLSGNRAHDRLTKRFIYGQSGVQEYWIIDTAGSVERWIGDGLSRREEIAGVLRTPLLPGFSLDVERLWSS